MESYNDNFIQLPPLDRSTEGLTVMMLWEYLKLPEETRKTVFEDLKMIKEMGVLGESERKKQPTPEQYRKVKLEEIEEYKDAMSEMIRMITLEASDIACWVFAKKYIDGWDVDQMVKEMPHAAKFIVAMDVLFEQNIKENGSQEKEILPGN